MKLKTGRRWLGAFLILAWAGGIVLGCGLLGAYNFSDIISPEAAPSFRLMAEAWNTIQQYYVNRRAVQARDLAYGAITGMVAALGDTGHSRFLSPDMARQEKSLSQGNLEGIGAEVQMKRGQLVIVAPIDGSPAQRSGLKPGDVILRVNGEGIENLTLEQAVARILGPPGTPVRLTILKADGTSEEMTLLRARILLRNVTRARVPGTDVVHLRIASFSKGVSGELKKELRALLREKPGGLILDLRNNPGGLFREAVETASQFLSGGNVLLEKNARGEIKPVPVKPGGEAVTVPLVVLINGGSASAAEIVAGAIQDQHRAPLLGEKTFGTGTVLEPFSLSDGSKLLLATLEWLTPAGQVIWHQGISPDIPVALPPDTQILTPAIEKGLSAAELRRNSDKQVLKALERLSQGRQSRN